MFVGAENWPFPIPLVSHKGVWQFDSKAGSDEILFRRIGENEVTAIVACDTLVTQQTRGGTDSDADRLIKTLLPQSSKPNPFHGYYFHMLRDSGGGIVAIAYPAMYRSSGVMTFIATEDGNVSEKDLGASTAKIAQAMTAYHADGTWTPVESTP